jgi:hypothetical protein
MKGKMFKYICSLLLLFVALSGNSQTINGRLYTQFNNYYKWRGGAFDSVLLLPNLTGTAGLRGGALRYNGSDSSLYVYTGTQWQKIGGGGSTPTLQQVTNQGFTTTTDILKTDGFGRKLVETRGSVSQGQLRIFNPLESGGENNHTTYGRHGIAYIGNVNTGAAIQYPDTTGIGQRFVIGAKLNGTAFFPSIGGFIDLGTITSTPDSSIFATRFWVNSNFQPIGNYVTTGSNASLQSLNITGTNGNGHIHLRHQASLPPATGQSTTIYANSLGNFAWKNDGGYHTTFKTDANTADRTYTFQNKDYTVADNAEVVKYTDTSAMLSPYLRSNIANATYQLQLDTVPLVSFGAGSGAAGDTSAFTTSAVYGSFYNDGSDTLIITQMRAGVLGTSPSITTEIYWDDSLNITAGATILVSGGTSVTGTIGATNVTSFTNNKIPPGVWVFCRTSAVATKPTYFTLTLLGYKKRK